MAARAQAGLIRSIVGVILARAVQEDVITIVGSHARGRVAGRPIPGRVILGPAGRTDIEGREGRRVGVLTAAADTAVARAANIAAGAAITVVVGQINFAAITHALITITPTG